MTEQITSNTYLLATLKNISVKLDVLKEDVEKVKKDQHSLSATGSSGWSPQDLEAPSTGKSRAHQG